jgi:hypothetical protein
MNKKKIWEGLVLTLSLLFFVVKVSAASWWTPAGGGDKGKVWHYRIPIMLTAPEKLDYSCYPIEISVDFKIALEKAGSSSETLDMPNSLRLVLDGKEIPYQYDDTIYQGKEDESDNDKGTVVFVLGTLKSGAYKKYFLYFDTIEKGGTKKKPEYPFITAEKSGQKINTGKIGVYLQYYKGSRKHRSGINVLTFKKWSFETGKTAVGIPIAYRYWVDSLGLVNTPWQCEFVKGPVFARYSLSQTANHYNGGMWKPDDPIVIKKKMKLWEEPKTFKATFTFFNNSSIWFLEDWYGNVGCYMKPEFETYQDSSMESPVKLTELKKARHKAHYGLATLSNGVAFATALRSKDGSKETIFQWDNEKYTKLPFLKTKPGDRVVHYVGEGGMDAAKALYQPPKIVFSPNKVEKKEEIL